MTRTKDSVHEFEAKLARLSDDERRLQEGIDLINWVGWMLVPVDIKRACVLFDEAREHAEAIDYRLGIARARFGSAFRDFFTADYAEALRTLHANAPGPSRAGKCDRPCQCPAPRGDDLLEPRRFRSLR